MFIERSRLIPEAIDRGLAVFILIFAMFAWAAHIDLFSYIAWTSVINPPNVLVAIISGYITFACCVFIGVLLPNANYDEELDSDDEEWPYRVIYAG